MESELYKSQSPEITHSDVQVANFPKTEEFLNKRGIVDKKDLIKEVLQDHSLQEGFEEFLNSKDLLNEQIKCKKDLKECKTLDEIKSIIVENIQGGYKIGVIDGKSNENQDFDKNQNDVLKSLLTEVDREKNQKEQDKSDLEDAKLQGEAIESKLSSAKDVNDAEKQATEDSEDKENERKEAINEQGKILGDLYEDLKTKHATLEENVQKNFESVKQQLESDGILDQIREEGGSEDTINNYILINATLQEAKRNLEYGDDEISSIEKAIKQFNNACKIPDTNVESFSPENVTETRQELFNSDTGNEELIEAKNKSKDEHASEYEKLLTMDDKEAISNYGKFIADSTTKDIYDRYKKEEELSDDEYNQLKGMIDKIKFEMDEKTKDLVEQLCVISQINGMSKCIGNKFEDQFEFNKAKEVKSNDGIIIIEGHVDGVDFYLRQDTKDSDARLQTSCSIFKRDNSYNIGDNFEDSPFMLPTKEEVFNIAKQSISSGKVLSESSTPAEYVQKLQKSIMDDMDGLYSDTNLAHHYMEDKIKQEKVAQNTIGLLDELSGSKIMGQVDGTNKKLFDFIKLMDFNAKNSTFEEKKSLDDCIRMIRDLVSKYGNSSNKPKDGEYPKILEKFLMDDKILNDTKNQIDNGLSSGDTLFKLFYFYKNTLDGRHDSEGYMIDFTALEKDLSGSGEFSEKAQEREDDNFDVEGHLASQLDGI